MIWPKLRALESSRQMVDEFKGYNHNLRIGEGEFFDMKNMTSDHYPVLSPRGKRWFYSLNGDDYPDKPTGMIAKDSLCFVQGRDFYINRAPVDMGLNDEPKQLVSMGAYVIIMPDKKYINTKDGSFGNIEATWEATSAEYAMCKIDGTAYRDETKEDGKIEIKPTAPENPVNMQLWIDNSTTPHVLKQYSESSAVWMQIATTYVRISAPGIAKNFSQYDAVKITGLPTQLADFDGGVSVLWDAYHDPGDKDLSRAEGTNDYIVIIGILDEATTHKSSLKVERTMPEMDFVIEANNRLWGCRYGQAKNGEVVNEIYCSKLGDFKNWNCFMGISTDSWVASCGTDGQFTGAITHMGYPLFFKENYVHKVYGNYPANFQIQTTACNGVQKGCDKSLAIVNTTLFYKARDGVYAYDGSLPSSVSYALGNTAYDEAVGGAHGNKYYISMKDNLGAYSLFVFDTAKGMWHREDDLQVSQFCSCRGDMYAICGNDIITMTDTENLNKDPVEWMVETGEIGISSPDMKYISRITLRMSMDIGTEVRIYVQYDFNQVWEQVCSLTGDSLRSFSLPIRPQRCDYMKLRIEGIGAAKIYSITKTIEQGSELS